MHRRRAARCGCIRRVHATKPPSLADLPVITEPKIFVRCFPGMGHTARIANQHGPTDYNASAFAPNLAMSYTLTMAGVIVGRSELEMRDAAARIARGAFRPGLGYELAQ